MQKVLKAYTDKFGLIKSIPIQSQEHLKTALQELSLICNVKTVYLTDGKNSRQIKFTSQNPSERPLYFTRPDGTRCYTLSINPANYPMTAHYGNGSTQIIKL